MKRCRVNCFTSKKGILYACSIAVGFISSIIVSFGQDGVAGIQEANNKVRGYFNAGTNLMYAIGAIVGLIGAVKVYQKWSNGHQDTGSVAAAWFGSCVFLVVVATVLKSFFGL
ncbi:DUF4134 domain-containing protein [Segetibacter koreensis]|uniref:DUF4134 domain-containing protein n=1 Tax=Segetibacter koreensis TaxID=398037 RepID=UPI000376A7FC|nr:DUF4134 domain-containing protein [Segetibacter koreensis]